MKTKKPTADSLPSVDMDRLWAQAKGISAPASSWIGRKIESTLVPDNILVFPHFRHATSQARTGTYHPRYVLDIITGSPGSVRIGDSNYLLEEGDALLIFPHQYNRTPNEGPDHKGKGWIIITFDLKDASSIQSLRNSPRKIRKQEVQLVTDLLQNYHQHGCELELSLLLSKLLRSLTTAPQIPASRYKVSTPDSERDELMEKINEYIFQNLENGSPTTELANQLGYSESQLRNLFRRTTGWSIGAYIRRQRLFEAARRLTVGENNITEIAAQLGFSSVHAFSHTFKTVYGVSPKQYEKMVRENVSASK